MINTGQTRKLDDVGRLVIPKSIRAAMELKDGEEMEFLLDDKKKYMVIRPCQESNPLHELAEAVNTFMAKADVSDSQELKNISRELKKIFGNLLTNK